MSLRSRASHKNIDHTYNLLKKSSLPAKKRKSEEHAEREKSLIKRKQDTSMTKISESDYFDVIDLCSSDEKREVCLLDNSPPSVIETAGLKHHQLTCLFPLRNTSFSPSPLPILSWADPIDVWRIMVQKDKESVKDKHLLNRHPLLQPRMRSILLDWLIEVCELYQLHRETYYLAMDFIDRFLACQKNIPKQQLQLIGITCLFTAAKLEEIYPPKLSEFAHVTDEACTEKEILMQELIILKSLQWNLSPMTANSWLNVYMQLSNKENIVDSSDNFIFPQYSGHAFIQIAQLIDLCMLDEGCLQFPYRVIAASALLHMTSSDIFHSVTGLELEDVATCVLWLQPFAVTVREAGGASIKVFKHVSMDDLHNIQTHSTNIELLESAQAKKSTFDSPLSTCNLSQMLTPPQSMEKKELTWS